MALEARKVFELEDAVLLARRSMFSATATQIREMQLKGLEQSVTELLEFDLELQAYKVIKLDSVEKAAQKKRLTINSWLFEMLHSKHAFRERLAFAWHNHLVVGNNNQSAQSIEAYIQALRKHGLNSFETLVQVVSKTTAMLHYLDNKKNVKGNPNENFARELLELFTLGIGNYSEEDVAEAARALTGWSLDDEERFIFRPEKHDDGLKTFLGEQAHYSGEDIIRIAAEHDATAQFVAMKLLKAFVTDKPTQQAITQLAKTFKNTHGNLKEVLRELLSSDLFYSSSQQIIKSPSDWLLGALRGLGFKPQEAKVYNDLRKQLEYLGQLPLSPPNVGGWSGGRSWISDSSLIARIKVAKNLCNSDLIAWDSLNTKDLKLALLGQTQSPLDKPLSHLEIKDQVFLILVSPEYALS